MKTSLYWIALISFFISACTSTGKKAESSPQAIEKSEKAASSREADEPEIENVDFVALQRALGLEKPNEKLGYAERLFDTCDVGYGYSKNKNCRQRYFVVVHFQLMCRDSEGTVSEIVRAADLQPNRDRSVRWNLKGANGSTNTDGDGFGQIRVISAQSQKQQRLKLTVESDFLYLRAGEVNKIVTPKTWCQ